MTENGVALQPVSAYSNNLRVNCRTRSSNFTRPSKQEGRLRKDQSALLKTGATHRNRTDNLRITNALLCLVELGWLVADESTALPIELHRRELVYLLRL